jgi:2-dehydro-3-deoxyphosphogluconate aldolase/(4S)-4-hydroxy-2-oxoglutarate aldolase
MKRGEATQKEAAQKEAVHGEAVQSSHTWGEGDVSVSERASVSGRVSCSEPPPPFQLAPSPSEENPRLFGRGGGWDLQRGNAEVLGADSAELTLKVDHLAEGMKNPRTQVEGGRGHADAAGAAGGVEQPFNLRELLLRHRLLPTARPSSAEEAVHLAGALTRAGLPLLQISLTTSVALSAIEAVRRAFPNFGVGAASVLSPAQLNDALAAGARFGSGPVMHPALLAAALSADFPFLPGAMTPSEIECGIQWGFLTQCFYPAASAGGPAMVRALAAPFRHTRLVLVPAGGLRMADFQEYLVVPAVAAVAGRFVCERALVEAGLWEDLEAQAVLCTQKVAAALRERFTAPQTEGNDAIYR